ncbi:hypothetical protein CDAR_276381 [Caerostris darwini]|uniref:Uncharacterized protein n=1 Tax=Caerostris darwini TaxID=1538125 RepID=A0AAV4N1P8_9ARAC|nr:hypothetical protein CDAR_276381 [Caerostris darwini]
MCILCSNDRFRVLFLPPLPPTIPWKLKISIPPLPSPSLPGAHSDCRVFMRDGLILQIPPLDFFFPLLLLSFMVKRARDLGERRWENKKKEFEDAGEYKGGEKERETIIRNGLAQTILVLRAFPSTSSTPLVSFPTKRSLTCSPPREIVSLPYPAPPPPLIKRWLH